MSKDSWKARSLMVGATLVVTGALVTGCIGLGGVDPAKQGGTADRQAATQQDVPDVEMPVVPDIPESEGTMPEPPSGIIPQSPDTTMPEPPSGTTPQPPSGGFNGGSTPGAPSSGNSGTSSAAASTTLLDTSDQFSNRDLLQSPDISSATMIAVKSGQDVHITKAGYYVLSGTATDVTIYVEAGDSDKVQLILDGLKVTNADMPVIYALTGDKLFVTTASGSENTLAVTGAFADGSAVIQSKCDLTLNGEGTLTVTSAQGKGIKGSDDLKITGGTYVVTSVKHAFEANDSIRIADGKFTVNVSDKDAFHAENEDDDTKGYIYIAGGTFDVTAASDAFEGDAFVVIDDGTFAIAGSEGIEGTYVQINGGDITINASDDGINASEKSTSYTPTVEINGGDITITMGRGDTDAIDSNGNLFINGGTLDITAQSAFDWDGQATLSDAATVTVNGSRVMSLSNQFGGGMGGFGGGMGGFGGGPGGGMGGQGNPGFGPGSGGEGLGGGGRGGWW